MSQRPVPPESPAPRCRSRSAARAAAGFTMIELVVTMTVAAILVAIGIPAMQTFIQNGRNSSQAAAMVIMLTYARNEALKRDVAGGVTVCPSADGQNCDPAGNWANAWIVPDPVTPANPPLQVGTPLSTSNTITEANGRTAVVFLPSGAAQTPATFKICDSRGSVYAREFEVNQSGRVIASATVGQSVNGAALACP